MPRLSLGLGLALLLVLFLLLSAPARLVSTVLPAGQVYMQGFSGTLWNGRASRCLVQAGPGYLQLGAVSWELSPLSLLILAPRLTIHSQWGQQRLSGDIVLRGEGDLDLHDLEATFAADLVRQFAPMALAGSVQADFDELLVRDRMPVTGSGRLVWQNGAWDAPQGFLPLGSYAMEVTPDPGGGLAGEVLTLSGPVEAEGSTRLRGREYSVDVLVGGEGGLDSQVERALNLIATPENGRFRVALEGEFQG